MKLFTSELEGSERVEREREREKKRAIERMRKRVKERERRMVRAVDGSSQPHHSGTPQLIQQVTLLGPVGCMQPRIAFILTQVLNSKWCRILGQAESQSQLPQLQTGLIP